MDILWNLNISVTDLLIEFVTVRMLEIPNHQMVESLLSDLKAWEKKHQAAVK